MILVGFAHWKPNLLVSMGNVYREIGFAMGWQTVAMEQMNLMDAKGDAINMNLHAKIVDVLRKE